MSITAITTGNKNSKAIIPWFRTRYVLTGENEDVCSIEFIIKVEQDCLKDLNIFIPYKIDKVEDMSLGHLDKVKNNSQFKKYDVNQVDLDSHKICDITFSHNIVDKQLNDIKACVFKYNLNTQINKYGSILKIFFTKPIPTGELASVRFIYEYINTPDVYPNEIYEINYRYYTIRDIVSLKIDNLVDVEAFQSYTFFPKSALIIRVLENNIYNKERTWGIPRFDPSTEVVIFGDRNKTLWKDRPIKNIEWAIFSNKPSLFYGAMVHFGCVYEMLKQRRVIIPAGTGMHTESEELDYIVWVRGDIPYQASAEDVEFLKKDISISLLLDENGAIFVNGDDKTTLFKKRALPYALIRLFILNKGRVSFERAFIERKRVKKNKKASTDHHRLTGKEPENIKNTMRYIVRVLGDLDVKGKIDPIADEFFEMSDDVKLCWIKSKNS